MSTEKEDKKTVLNGWMPVLGSVAALLTAIATLLTALGAPNFFPDMMKRLIPGDLSTHTPTSTPSQSPNSDTW